MITGVQVAGRNDQVAGTTGSDVRTNGEYVGTRYGTIYIGSEGNKGKPSEFRSRSSGTGLGEQDLTEKGIRTGMRMGMRLWESRCNYGRKEIVSKFLLILFNVFCSDFQRIVNSEIG
jgi:hypothetical protein